MLMGLAYPSSANSGSTQTVATATGGGGRAEIWTTQGTVTMALVACSGVPYGMATGGRGMESDGDRGSSCHKTSRMPLAQASSSATSTSPPQE